MDGRTYIEEVKSRIHRYATAEDLNDLEIMTYVNLIRKVIQNYVMSSMPERFGRIETIGISDVPTTTLNVNFKDVFLYPCAIPTNFIEEIVVKIVWIETINGADVAFSRQARKAEHTEVHSISMNSWGTPFTLNPIYNVGQDENNVLANKVMFIGGLDYSSTSTTLFDRAKNNEVYVELWYEAMLDDLEFNDRETVYVGDLQELVILQTIMMCLKRSQPEGVYPILKNEIDMLTMVVQKNYNALIAERELNLETKQ